MMIVMIPGLIGVVVNWIRAASQYYRLKGELEEEERRERKTMGANEERVRKGLRRPSSRKKQF